MLFLTYTDMLRVALIKGEMNFPVLPKSKRMPGNEMQRAIYEMGIKMGGEDEAPGSAPSGEGEVPKLWGDTPSPDGAVPAGRHPQTVSGRGDLREVPEVQEDGPRGDRGTQGGADPASRLAGDTQGVTND